MRISEVIQRLERIKAQHGDVPCGIHDADTGWQILLVDSKFTEAIRYDERGGVLFEASYDGESLFGDGEVQRESIPPC